MNTEENNDQAEAEEVGLLDILEFAATFAAALSVAPEVPERGSADYIQTLEAVAELEDQEDVTNALSGLWGDFGWRGLLDMMVEWVLQIDTHPNLRPESRDMFGVVDISTIIMLNPDEELMLHIAARHTKKSAAREEDIAPHEAFKRSMEMTERVAELGARWQPTFHAAFKAATECAKAQSVVLSGQRANGGTAQNRWEETAIREARQKVFAALFRGPTRTDRQELMSVAMMFATAAMGVRNSPEMLRKFNSIGREHVVESEEINPRWNGAYKRRP
ncbi:hypothetical protein [Streptomyces sp. NPDC059278]|uniref:hypothetical protein n=1 Tax=Streptomyces sp. NPDC059278 TaxID=3346801 RepID=UPI0036CDC3D1